MDVICCLVLEMDVICCLVLEMDVICCLVLEMDVICCLVLEMYVICCLVLEIVLDVFHINNVLKSGCSFVVCSKLLNVIGCMDSK